MILAAKLIGAGMATIGLAGAGIGMGTNSVKKDKFCYVGFWGATAGQTSVGISTQVSSTPQLGSIEVLLVACVIGAACWGGYKLYGAYTAVPAALEAINQKLNSGAQAFNTIGTQLNHVQSVLPRTLDTAQTPDVIVGQDLLISKLEAQVKIAEGNFLHVQTQLTNIANYNTEANATQLSAINLITEKQQDVLSSNVVELQTLLTQLQEFNLDRSVMASLEERISTLINTQFNSLQNLNMVQEHTSSALSLLSKSSSIANSRVINSKMEGFTNLKAKAANIGDSINQTVADLSIWKQQVLTNVENAQVGVEYIFKKINLTEYSWMPYAEYANWIAHNPLEILTGGAVAATGFGLAYSAYQAGVHSNKEGRNILKRAQSVGSMAVNALLPAGESSASGLSSIIGTAVGTAVASGLTHGTNAWLSNRGGSK